MRSLRRLGLVLWLALSLVAGQQLVHWHDLGHAGEKLAALDGDGRDAGDSRGGAPSKCEQHFTFAQLSGALGSAALAAAFVAPVPPRASAPLSREASLAPRRTFLSRAPPSSLA